MEHFRLLLKTALAANAKRVRISPGEHAEWIVSDNTPIIGKDIPIFDMAALKQLVAFLFPQFQEQIKKAEPITGTLQIPQVGALKLLAKHVGDLTIVYVYTAAGESLYQSDLASFAKPNNFTITPSLPPIPVPSTAPKQANELNAAPVKNAVVDAFAASFPAFSIPDSPPEAQVPEEEPKIQSSDIPMELPVIFEGKPLNSIGGIYMQTPDSVDASLFTNSHMTEGAVSEGSNLIDSLLIDMVSKKASDMHLTTGQPVIFRIDGEMTRQNGNIVNQSLMQQLLTPTMPEGNREEFHKNNDTDYAYELRGVGRFRMNVFRDRNGVGAVLRHIPSQILTTSQLNLAPAIMNLCKLNKGLVLVTGPTGSGKSTTLASMIDWINKNRSEHILTIEDPIEFVHHQQKCLINQREVHKHTGSFSRALKAALREDPDTIMIGEMRDLETMSIAIETAETGHLVFGTLHTTTAVSTVDRIIDQFPSDRQAQIRTMLASSLRGVVTQTLLKKTGGGRIAAHEILIVNDAVSSMIREGKNHMISNHMMTQKAEGNQLLNDSLFKLITDGLIDPQEALFKAVDKNDFVLSAARRNIKVA